MRRLTKNIPLILVATLVVVGLTWAMWPRPIEVETAEVTRGRMVVTVDEDGQTRIRERYIVSAPLAGRLRRVELDPGDAVEAGSTVLTTVEPSDPALLDPRQVAESEARMNAAASALEAAKRRLAGADADLAIAETEFGRIQQARERGGTTEIEFERARSLLRAREELQRAATFNVDVAQFELELARAAFVRTRPGQAGASEQDILPVRSPISGRVLRVFQESAAVVAPGTPLIEVGDPSDLEVVIDVLSTDAVSIRPGAAVELVHWGGSTPIPATVRLVEPAAFTKVSALGVDEQRVNIIIDFAEGTTASERAALGDAYRVEARITVWERDDAVRAPIGSIFRRGERWHVFTAINDTAALTPVEIGRRNGQWAEVIEGLQPGDTVIDYPSDALSDGVRIRRRQP